MVTDQKCTIFPHVPKCGGTSLKSQFEQSGLDVFFDYEYPPEGGKYFRGECERRNRESSLLDFGVFDLVFGHFPVTRYFRDNYRYVTLLRNPLDRAVSHFFYWKNVLPETNLVAINRAPIIRGIKDGTVSFTEFLMNQKIDKYLSAYLGEMGPEKFQLVGFTDQYDSFLHKLSGLIGVRLDPQVHLRPGVREPLESGELSKAQSLLGEEFRIYESFRNYWG